MFRSASALRNPRSRDLKIASLRAAVRPCGVAAPADVFHVKHRGPCNDPPMM
jgi:hypothetical protein